MAERTDATIPQHPCTVKCGGMLLSLREVGQGEEKGTVTFSIPVFVDSLLTP
jgi:hypothetical protein